MSTQRSSSQFTEQTTQGSIALWLFVLGATLLFIFLFILSRAARQNLTVLEQEVVLLETAVATQLSGSEGSGFSQELAMLEQQLAQIDMLNPTLDAQQVNWPLAMQAIRNLNPNEVRIEIISQQPGQLSIQGQAVSDTAVNAYAEQLNNSGAFSRVIIQSLIADNEPFATVPPTPTVPSPTPAATNQPTAIPTQTPIPPDPTEDLRDDFEWDDHTAMPIFVGAPQTRSFFPNFDVDNAFFLAKAGRTYQISTEFLAGGVDTFLTVTIGDQTLTNDDAMLGVLESEIVVTAPADQDVNVYIRVTNRGAFGFDKEYDLSVVEIVPTVVPTQPTPTPGPTLTPTPDLRDAFEPDDPPAVIAVNESQLHNFHPSVDVDYLQLLTKEQRSYQIVTSGLAAGVDTVISVDLDRILFENDDFSPPGFSDLSSSICFSSRKDSVALFEIRNKGQLFDPDRTYFVSAFEQPFYVDKQQLEFGAVSEGSAILSQQIQISNETGLDWTAVSAPDWLQLDITSGFGSDVVTATVDTTGLQPDEYRGEITLTWEGVCNQIIPVLFTVQAASSQSLPSNGMAARLESERFLAKPYRQQQNGVEFIIVVEFATP